MEKQLYKYRKILLLLSLVIFFSFIIPSLNKPFVMLEIGNVCMAQSINEFGLVNAVTYEKMLKCTGIYTNISEEAHTYHAPTYLILLGLSLKAFGTSEVSARIVPLIFATATLFLVYFLSLAIFKNNKKKYTISLLAAFLYSINPLVIQSSTLIFSDSIATLFPTILSFYIFIKFYSFIKRYFILAFIIMTFILFWTKLQVPALFSFSIFFYLLLNKDFKLILKLFSAVLIGTILFFVSWFFISLEFQLPFTQMISYNLHIFGKSAISPLYKLLLIAWSTKNIIFWIVPGFFILFCIAVYKRIRNYFSIKKAEYIDLLVIYSVFTSLFFLFLHEGAFGFPIFNYTIMPLAAIIISHFLSELKVGCNKKLIYISIGFVLLLFIFNIYVLKDPFIPHNIFYTKSIDVGTDLETYFNSSLNGIWYIAPLLFGFLIFKLFRYKSIKALIITALITLTVTCFYINGVQAPADYSTTLGYGQNGLIEAANYINKNTKEEDMIISRVDIAYYANRSFISLYSDPEYLNRITSAIETGDIQYIALSSSERLPDIKNRYYLDAKFGNFKIFKKIKEDKTILDEQFAAKTN